MGLASLLLAELPPIAVAGVILNDIGPVMEPRGLMRIKSYVGKLPIARNFEEGAEILRWLFGAQFTKLAPQDWIAFAQRTWREHRGALMLDHDLKLARALRGVNLERLPTFWDQFDALAHIPLMVIRGANSDMLASTTLNAMLARRGQLEVVVVPDQGHAPLLAEPNVIRRIAAFVASCDAPARTRWSVTDPKSSRRHWILDYRPPPSPRQAACDIAPTEPPAAAVRNVHKFATQKVRGNIGRLATQIADHRQRQPLRARRAATPLRCRAAI